MAIDSTTLQNRIYDYIVTYMQSHQGLPPTFREIGTALHLASSSHVDYHLSRLEKRGLITRQSRMCRGIALTGKQDVLVLAQVMHESGKTLQVRVVRNGKVYRGRLNLEQEQ